MTDEETALAKFAISGAHDWARAEGLSQSETIKKCVDAAVAVLSPDPNPTNDNDSVRLVRGAS